MLDMNNKKHNSFSDFLTWFFEGNIDTENTLANTPQNHGLSSDILNTYNQDLEKDPLNYTVLNNKYYLLRELGLVQDALDMVPHILRVYNNILATDPNNIQILFSKGLFLKTISRNSEVLKIADVLLNIAKSMYVGQYNEATSIYDKVLKLDPNNVEAQRLMGLTLFKSNKYEEAAHVFSRIQSRESDSQVLIAEAEALTHLNKNDDALNVFNQLLKIQPTDTRTIGGKITILARLHRLEEALDLINAASKDNLADSDILQMRPAITGQLVVELNQKGVVYYNNGETQEATKIFNKVLSLNSDNITALTYVGKILHTAGNIKEASIIYDKILIINPRHPNALNNKGVILYNLGLNREALNLFNKAIEYGSQEVIIIAEGNKVLALRAIKKEDILRGNTLFNLERYREAIELYNGADVTNDQEIIRIAENNKKMAIRELKIKEGLEQAPSPPLDYRYRVGWRSVHPEVFQEYRNRATAKLLNP